jgi:hypothetical protein
MPQLVARGAAAVAMGEYQYKVVRNTCAYKEGRVCVCVCVCMCVCNALASLLLLYSFLLLIETALPLLYCCFTKGRPPSLSACSVIKCVYYP